MSGPISTSEAFRIVHEIRTSDLTGRALRSAAITVADVGSGYESSRSICRLVSESTVYTKGTPDTIGCSYEFADRRSPSSAVHIRALIRQMHAANPLWGAPRIHGELQKLGLTVSQSTVAKYLGRRDHPPSPTWRTFLTNHLCQLASIDFFTVPTATFRVLFVFLVLSHDRRRIVHVNVTAHPTAAWTGQQLRDAWPWNTAPQFVIRDRDTIYGPDLRRAALAMGIEEVLTAPRAPWQNPFVERVIGSIRRECLDHVIVWNERALRRHLQQYLAYYHEWRTHLSLDKDAPVARAVQPPRGGPIVRIPHLGGLHHHYERRAA